MALYRQIEILRPKLPRTFGTARWALLMDLIRAGMVKRAGGKRAGPIIGCLTPAEAGGRDIHRLFANGETSLLSFGPAGSGKTSGQIITNLLWWPGPAWVLDLKSENYDRTAGWRAANGHRVYRFSPFHRDSVRWNPIDYINDGCTDAPNDPRGGRRTPVSLPI